MPVNARAITFISLNGIRILSVISLILVFSSTIFVMVNNIKAVNAFEANKGNMDLEGCDYIENSTVPNQPAGVFWAVVASLLILFQTIILFLSEISWPMKFFDRYFPVLGSEFGLGALGIFQGLISTQILSHHVDDFSLVSAFFLFALGCLNMLLGLIFRESAKPKRSITSWRTESKGVLPTHTGSSSTTTTLANGRPATYFPDSGAGLQRGGSEHGSTYKGPLYGEKAGYGFGTHGEKAAGLRGFILQKPDEALPRYMTPPPQLSRSGTKRSSSSSFESPSHRRSDSRDSEAGTSRSHRSLSPSEGRRTPYFKSSPTAL
ncbi:hypothetical protein P691DRAFT_702962 [Macrolepiota fuliginosa MF-IS2]|uniref:DUF7598 domain-containing protein n=1 Tax=Macrolepiota fuliginosa MF-IS2 TaxID=1400762 RepID=A0A9P5XDX7_9AGAR|nr:hypothetical protein P691DRAFT_702962 [Macrolepiota fuliginosa MF-IS2]